MSGGEPANGPQQVGDGPTAGGEPGSEPQGEEAREGRACEGTGERMQQRLSGLG